MEKEINNKDEIRISELFSILNASRIFLLKIVLIFSTFFVIYSLNLNDIYRSESILSVKQESGADGLLEQYGGLASLAGINLPSSSGDNGDLIIETIKSREFLKKIIQYEQILPGLIAAESYDNKTKKIIYDSDIYNESNKKWVRTPKKNRKTIPSYLEAHETYLDLLSVYKDPLTGYISVKVDHISPIFSQKLLEIIIFECNKKIQEKVLKDSDEALAYLDNELRKEPLNELRVSISELIKQKMKIKMTASVSEYYSFEIIEPPFMPEVKNRPSRSIICILGAFLGLFLGILYVWIKYYFKNEND